MMKMPPIQKKYIYLILFISLLYYLPGVISPRDFWVEDEARYGEILREMIHDGRWFVTYLNGTFYSDKPPIYFWLCALASVLLGKITVFSCMIVTWLSTVGCLLVTYKFSAELEDARSGFLSAMILLSTFLFIACAQIVRMDMLMTLFIIWALYLFYLGHHKKQRKYYTLFYVLTGLAVLSKGPFGFTFPFIPPLIFLAVRREWKEMRHFVFHWGFLIFLTMIGAWLGGAWLTGHRDFVHSLFLEQMAGRAVQSFAHKEPWYFYIMLLPGVMLPWFAFLFRAVYHDKRAGKPYSLLLYAWFVAGIVSISVISGKLFIYLLPVMPPAAMVLGPFFNRLLNDKSLRNRWFALESVSMTVLLFGLFAATPFVARQFPTTHMANLWPLAWVFIPVTVLGIVLGTAKKVRAFLIMTIAALWLFGLYGFLVIAPQTNPIVSARTIGLELASLAEKGYTVSTHDVRRGIFNFYADMLLPGLESGELTDYMQNPRHILVTKKKTYEKFKNQWPPDITILSCREIANEFYVVTGRRQETP